MMSDDRERLDDWTRDLARLEEIFAGWEEHQRGAVQAYRRAIEALHGEAVRRLIRALKGEPAALAAMKRAAGDEVVYAVLRRLEVIKPSLDERVEVALAGVRPMLASHGGDVELVKIEPPRVELRFLGACDGCTSSAMTFHAGVKQAVLDACPEITDIVQVRGSATGASHFVSPFALTQLGAWHRACELAEIPDGGVVAVTVRDRALLLSRRGGVPSCFDNACAHLGLALDGGRIADGVLTCPHHGFAYDLATGECLTAASVALAARAVRVVGAHVEVKLA